MKVGMRTGLFALAALVVGAATGCSGSGGGGILDRPSGTITLTDPSSGAVITTSPSKPYLVSDLRFTVNATEAHFGGPYSVNVVAQSNLPTAANGGYTYPFSFNVPCFTVVPSPIIAGTVPITFTGTNANGQASNFPTGTPSGSGNPCHSGEFETAVIADSDGHTLNFYYEEYP